MPFLRKKDLQTITRAFKNSNIFRWMKKHRIRDYNELLEKALKNPGWFWDELAGELEWFKPYKGIMRWDPPHAKWFLDGKFNIVHNALDRHAHGPQKQNSLHMGGRIWRGSKVELPGALQGG